MTRFKLYLLSALALIVVLAHPYPTEAQERQRRRTSQDRVDPREDSGRLRPTAQQYVERFDEDGNGAIDRPEASRWLSQRFDRLDRNGDDSVTSSELERGRRRSRGMASDQRRTLPVEVVYIWVADLDRGELNLDDIQSAYETLRQVDANDDGQITRSELNEQRQEMLGRWAQSMINRADSNDDNRISRQEASGTAIGHSFARIDRNGDNQVTRQELRQSMSGQFRQGSLQDGPQSSEGSQAYRSEGVDR
jgi:Ca2+-binding EF-hand superfamily protein